MTEPFLERSRYYLTNEYPAKLKLALEHLPPAAVWSRQHESSNSIGNLLVHLAGNVGEWIIGGLGGLPVKRHRASEFDRRSGPSGDELLVELNAVVRDADAVLAQITESDLRRAFTIQGRETTGLAAVYHVVEHFSMHTGQVILLAKMHAPGRIQFYDDAGGRAIPRWGGREGLSKGADDQHIR